MLKVKRVKRRTVYLYESEGKLVGIERKFRTSRFLLVFILFATVVALMNFSEHGEEILKVVSDVVESKIPYDLPIDTKHALLSVFIFLATVISVAVATGNAFVYTGVNSENALLNVILDNKKEYNGLKLGERKGKLVVEEFSDGTNSFRLVRYINGKRRKVLARRNEKLLAREILFAMEYDGVLLGERVAEMIKILKTADVERAEEDAHADLLMLALDTVVNYLRENDGVTKEELMSDKEIAKLDKRYVEMAIRYLKEASGGPYVKEVDGKLYLSKVLSEVG